MNHSNDENSIPVKVAISKDDSEETIDMLKDKIKEKEDLYVRVMAEFENYRKRMEREGEQKKRQGKKELVLELLEIIDNLERACNASVDDFHALKEGIQAIYQQFIDVLKKHKVVSIEAVGREFNPRFHEAMGSIETADYPPNTVGEEIRKGYLIENELLRPSLVQVVKS